MEIVERPAFPASPKNISPRLSIVSVRNDYRMNDRKDERASAQGLKLS
jgi:hypothetical protein